MQHSISYYIIILVLKLKGIKNDFSQDPIDYKKIRKEDVYQAKGGYFRRNPPRTFKIAKTIVSALKQQKHSDKLLIFIHGGAFISGPTQLHWDTLQQIHEQSNHDIWLCDYPKAPENKIAEISKNIDLVYQAALQEYPAEHITLIGDSVGGTLIASLTQRLVKQKLSLPDKIILISPVMDASMSNPAIKEIDQQDPMLSKIGVLSAKKMCAENENLNDEMISPIQGSFESFPHTILYLAENDITYPDQKLTVQKLQQAQVKTDIIIGDSMPHIWPLLPVMKEAQIALNQIIKTLNN